MKRKYYNKHGNQIRSKPKRHFYQKGSVWLTVFFLTIVVIIVIAVVIGKKDIVEETKEKNVEIKDGKNKMVDDNATTSKVMEDVNEMQTYTYEDFKGVYASFEGQPYDSLVGVSLALNDDQIITRHPWGASSSLDREITKQTIKGNVLTLDWSNPYMAEDTGTTSYEIHYQNENKTIRDINTGDTFFPMSNQALQDNYDQLEIDYARILLMKGVLGTEGVNPILHVNDNLDYKHSTFPSAFGNFNFVEELDLTLLRFDYDDVRENESIFIYYTSNGDGHITTYQLDEVNLILDGNVDDMKKEVFDTAETFYVEPSEPYLVADFIERIEFIYE